MNMQTYTIRSTTKATTFARVTFALLALVTIGGCQSDATGGHDEGFFPGEGSHRATSQFMQAQAASGARSDSTLRDVHFDGDQVNSLGREKLDLMLHDDEAIDPLIIYVDASDLVMTARVASVTAYLEDRGLQTSQIEFKTGQNPDNSTPIAPHLARMGKTELGAAGEGIGSGSSPSMGGSD